jgi:pyrroline-5-carboxylate reductase
MAIQKRIVFIGSGNMAEALISGLVGSGLVGKKNLTSTDVRHERLRYLKKKYGINTTADNREAIQTADIIFLAIKPQHMEDFLKEASPAFRKGQLVITIAAGITTDYIAKQLPDGIAIVRAMPNTPALIAEGAIGLAKGGAARPAHLALAKRLFSTVGIVVELPESAINAVTALSGSGPAYAFYLCEAMVQAGIDMGLQAEVADLLARQTMKGAGKMLAAMKTPVAELRKNVTSPGGTTAAALNHMEKKHFHDIVVDALQQAKKRAGELSR